MLHVAEDFTAAGMSVAIASALVRTVFVQGDTIIREGDDQEAMYFVMQGEVERGGCAWVREGRSD